MKIQVQIVSQFGQKRVFPVCEKACLFADLTNSKTFNQFQIDAIKALGYEVEVVPEVTSL